MNPEIKVLWLERLRSNKYEQGEVYLCRNGKYCCLGVLCEIAAEQGIVEKVTEKYAKIGFFVASEEPVVHYDGKNALLPHSVEKWAELDWWPRVNIDGTSMTLTALNDKMHRQKHVYDFHKIADLIETSL